MESMTRSSYFPSSRVEPFGTLVHIKKREKSTVLTDLDISSLIIPLLRRGGGFGLDSSDSTWVEAHCNIYQRLTKQLGRWNNSYKYDSELSVGEPRFGIDGPARPD